MDSNGRNPNITDNIFLDLRRQILCGDFTPGERLPGERELAQKYGTNRNTLREAVRKLEQSHLVTVRHGRGVTVCDFRRTGTLELLSPFLATGPDLAEVVHLVEDVLAPRILLIEHAARLAVRRADPSDIERLRDISDLLIAAFEAGDAAVVARGFQRWIDALVDAGHSIAIRWIANPFLEALRDTLSKFPSLWILEPSFPTHLREFISAVENGDEEIAVTTTRNYYERVDRQLLKLLRAAIPMQLRSRERARAAAAAPPDNPLAEGRDAKAPAGDNGATAAPGATRPDPPRAESPAAEPPAVNSTEGSPTQQPDS